MYCHRLSLFTCHLWVRHGWVYLKYMIGPVAKIHQSIPALGMPLHDTLKPSTSLTSYSAFYFIRVFFFTDCNLFLVWFKNVLFFQDWPSFSMLYFDHEDSGCNYQSTITPGSAYIPSSDVRSLDMAIAYSQSTNLRTRHHFHGNITE